MARPKKVRESKPEDVKPEVTDSSGDVFKDLNVEKPEPRVEVIRPDPHTEIRKVVD
jgi:hypothetical protein